MVLSQIWKKSEPFSSKEYLNLVGPAAMVMGVVFMAAMVSPFMNPTSPAGGMLFSFVLWGGMIFSGGMIFIHTQKMIDQVSAQLIKCYF
jgi:hypothetical protein